MDPKYSYHPLFHPPYPLVFNKGLELELSSVGVDEFQEIMDQNTDICYKEGNRRYCPPMEKVQQTKEGGGQVKGTAAEDANMTCCLH